MPDKSPKMAIDPELTRQLSSASTGSSVGAVFTLRSPNEQSCMDVTSVHETIKGILANARETFGHKENDFVVMPNIQSFAVDAPAPFVKSLLGNPAIASAMANAQSEDVVIRPPAKTGSSKKKRKPPLKGTG